MSKIRLAVVGATGLVGRTFLQILKERNAFEIFDIVLFASKKSKNKKIKINNRYYLVHELDDTFSEDIEYACFFTPQEISKIYIPIALKNNVKVVDNSSCFRMDENVKLIAFGVNDEIIDVDDKLISNPNCCIIQSMIAISALREYVIKQLYLSTYQSVSGSGKRGIEDLLRCRKGLMPLYYETDISFTCIPKIGDTQEDNFTSEENKMIFETKKILNDNTLNVFATCVRVPIMFGHGVSIMAEVEKEVDLKDIEKYYNCKDNITYCAKNIPSSILACKSDKVYVGRLRKVNNFILLYCTADNIRVGAATNAYLILERMVKLHERKYKKQN